MSSDSVEYEVMAVEVQELEGRVLNVAVYDLRPDDEATFTTGIPVTEVNADSPKWKREMPAELQGSAVVQYINHELRNAGRSYPDDGLIKEGDSMSNRVTDQILVRNPGSLVARVVRESDGYVVEVEADGSVRYREEFSDAELGLSVFSED